MSNLLPIVSTLRATQRYDTTRNIPKKENYKGYWTL